MAVLINGMKMPKNCNECRFCYGDTMDGMCRAAEKWFDDDYFTWYAYDEDDIDTSKPCNCPLIEIPPHGRLIDADLMKECCFMGDKLLKDALLEWIDVQRTVIEAEDGG